MAQLTVDPVLTLLSHIRFIPVTVLQLAVQIDFSLIRIFAKNQEPPRPIN